MNRASSSLSWLAVASALSLAACTLDTDEPDGEPTVATTRAALGASCVFGDGFVVPSGGHHIIYPVTCPSDCDDFPNGGLDYWLFCLDGVFGEWDPALTGGTVGPAINASMLNGYTRCSTKPNPWSTPQWAVTPDRRHCVQIAWP